MRDPCPYPRPTHETVCSWAGYLYFVFEREAIRVARANGYTGQLTTDPVLAKYRFTNIRRRDDRMTKWFIEHLITPAVEDGDEYLWFTLLIARLVNWPPTLSRLIEQGVLPCTPGTFDAFRFSNTIETYKNGGNKVFGGAYIVYPTMMNPGGNKSEALAEHIIGDAIKKAPLIREALWCSLEEPSIERFVDALATCFGVSTFIAGQVAADLSYTPGHLGEATDLYSWAPLGPGSQKGLNYLLGKDLQKQWKQIDFNTALIEANERICEELDITDLTLHDVQNTMCEFSKYARTVLGEGVPKSLYKPEKAY